MIPSLSAAHARRLTRLAGPVLLLAIALASGCFEEGTRQRYERNAPAPDPVEDPTGVGDPPPTGDPEPPPQEYVDAGPLQFRIQWDGSTTPTSEYVQGVDAAAGEAARGTADPNEDAGSDGG